MLVAIHQRQYDPLELYYPPTGGRMIRRNISIHLPEAVDLQNYIIYLSEAECPAETLVPS